MTFTHVKSNNCPHPGYLEDNQVTYDLLHLNTVMSLVNADYIANTCEVLGLTSHFLKSNNLLKQGRMWAC